MSDPSRTCARRNSRATAARTSSRASAAGISRSGSRAGRRTGPSGQVPVPASPFHRPEGAEALRTSAISGRYGETSSRSAALQRSLESRLLQRMAAFGSPEYALTWKRWDMPSGPPISALRASARRTSANGSGGWPTPVATDGRSGARVGDSRRGPLPGLRAAARAAGWPTPKTPTGGPNTKRKERNAGGPDLQEVAHLSGWNTPRATDGSNGGPNQTGGALSADAARAGWATPAARDWKSDRSTKTDLQQYGTKGRPLPRQVLGAGASGSPAPTGSGGALNPALPRWLMGYPAAWESYADTATQLSLLSERSS